MMKTYGMNVSHILDAVELGLNAGKEKGDPTERQLNVLLEEIEIWKKFEENVNEMIVTKSGRRMFPVLKVSVCGLDPESMYSVVVEFVQIDAHRWKYVNGEWIAGGKAEPPPPNCVYMHPDSPNFGAHWMKDSVHFNKVKLTNKPNPSGMIMLNSLHKYEPRIHIIKVGNREERKHVSTVSFKATHFIAVTAYQNEEVTALKIKFNPFAKAFLDAKERPLEHRDFDLHTEMTQSQYPQLNSWYLPPHGSLCSPSAAHYSNSNNSSSNSQCERYPISRSQRPSPYPQPYQRHSPTQNFCKREPSPCLMNIPENWNPPVPINLTSAATQYTMWPGHEARLSPPNTVQFSTQYSNRNSPLSPVSIYEEVTTESSPDPCDSPPRQRSSRWTDVTPPPSCL
uniref:Transcription factor T-Box n=1 Tax=Euperipatoides kanangrensis TaxID=488523 RepID=A0A0E4G3Y0_9BILA|nr:transcription factor T-Box [Euperipatoides kanangrensis]